MNRKTKMQEQTAVSRGKKHGILSSVLDVDKVRLHRVASEMNWPKLEEAWPGRACAADTAGASVLIGLLAGLGRSAHVDCRCWNFVPENWPGGCCLRRGTGGRCGENRRKL
jgi:hypothetical protein